jgi:peptidoglycan/xylan/chitin deacetylase (PgdA/CDA1 family)
MLALTFHGAGDPRLVKGILKEVESAGAQVTVLAVGTWLDRYPELARRILDGGHELGNHTQNHSNIKAMSPHAAHAEIAECARRLHRLTGSIGAWFRPSQTQHAPAFIRAEAARVGYRSCLSYDLDSRDYTDPGAAVVTHNVLAAVRPGSIVSMHFGHAGTLTAMPAILDGLRRRRLSPVTATRLLTS